MQRIVADADALWVRDIGAGLGVRSLAT